MEFTFAQLTDRGLARDSNQDAVFAGPCPGGVLLAVADGLGGHAAGEWASQRAIDVLRESLANEAANGSPGDALERAFVAANRAVHEEATERGQRRPATTLVAALVRGGEAWWANVGDSRIYCFGPNGLDQLSDDHSWVAEQVRAGVLTEKAAETHFRRSMVTRTIGFDPDVEVDVGGPVRLAEGDGLLLSSDGLHGFVSARDIERALKNEPAKAAARLIARANKAGGLDNITVVVGRMVRARR